LEKQDWGYFTKKTGSNKLFMVVFNTPISGAYRVKLPAKMGITKAYTLAQPTQSLTTEEIHTNEYFIHLKKHAGDQPFVIVLETTSSAKESGNVYDKAKT
jgi:alpha-L-fucosidase